MFPSAVEPVTLIHIPRTGGTSAEACTANEKHGAHRWGALNPVLHADGKRTIINNKTGAKCFGQHVPPNVVDFYTGQDTFCVVRDPFARMISVYGYRNVMIDKDRHPCTPEMMNVRLIEWLTKVKGGKKKPAFYLHDCHMLPQSAWVYGWDPDGGVVNRSMRGCNHVLQFGNLVSEFNALMSSKGYAYRLTRNKRQMSSPSACAALAKSDLSDATKELIREVYRDDFELLGFPLD